MYKEFYGFKENAFNITSDPAFYFESLQHKEAYSHLLYGIKHRVDDHPLGARTHAAGLYLAGQSILAPGLVGAMLSSFLTCGTILGHERMLKELQVWR